MFPPPHTDFLQRLKHRFRVSLCRRSEMTSTGFTQACNQSLTCVSAYMDNSNTARHAIDAAQPRRLQPLYVLFMFDIPLLYKRCHRAARGYILTNLPSAFRGGGPSGLCDCMQNIRQISCCTAYVDDSNTIGHITGYILTSLPLGRGGWSPYSVVPTCILQAGDHLFHDEVGCPGISRGLGLGLA